MNRKTGVLRYIGVIAVLMTLSLSALAQARKPNILIIWGDDIGQFNVSTYNMGMMGYRRRTLTASVKRVRCLRTGMDSRAAPPAARHSLPGNRPCARA